MAGFDNDVVYGEQGLRIGTFPLATSEKASIEFDESGGSVALLTHNTSNTASSEAYNEIKIAGTTAANAYSRYTIGSSTSWALGTPTAATTDGDAQINLVYKADGNADPDNRDYLPLRCDINKGGTNQGRAIARSQFAVASEGEASGKTVLLHAQNVETAVDSHVELLLQGGDPTLGAGGGSNFIRWGCLNQAQFTLGQGKDLTPSTQSLQIKTGSTFTAGVLHFQMEPSGEVTFPTTAAFCATNNASQLNKTGTGTTYTVAFGAERFDQNLDYSNPTFTAPVTGRYFFQGDIAVDGITAAATTATLSITTSNHTYIYNRISASAARTGGSNSFCLQGSVLADMDAADTCVIQVAVAGEVGDTVDIVKFAESSFSGFLQC